MALINCPECKKQVSDKASACPNCGYPLGNISISSSAVNPKAIECPYFPPWRMDIGKPIGSFGTIVSGNVESINNTNMLKIKDGIAILTCSPKIWSTHNEKMIN